MNEIYSGADLQRYIAKNGPLMRLTGNVAPKGVTVDLTTVPADMIGMRGVARMAQDAESLARALRTGQVPDGSAIFLLKEQSCGEDTVRLLEAAVTASGRRHLALTLSCRPARSIRGIVNLWFASPEDAEQNHVTVLRDGDRTEYDVNASLYGVDLIECLDHRLSERAAEPFYYKELGSGVTMIGEEFTRMFLIVGRERALLIDAGFGYGNLDAAVRKFTALPYDVALTHGHFDHAGGIRFFAGRRVYLHPADNPCVAQRQGDEILGQLTPLEDGHVFDLGGRRIRTIWLPGHSKGSVVFLEEATGTLFAGDSLLCGPFFLLNGEQDIRTLRDGLTRLLDPALGVRTIYPAHRQLFPMRPDDAREIIGLLDKIVSHTIPGCPTWIAPMEPSPYQTYRSGQFSVYGC